MCDDLKLPPLNEELIKILGRPNFACHGIASALRAKGHEIRQKAEHEQAAAIHFMLGLYLEHGANWPHAAEAYFRDLRERYDQRGGEAAS